MKPRSLKPRSSKPATPKPSAEDRTVPMNLDPDEGGNIKCPTCDEVSPGSRVTVRPDGKLECPACGSALPPPSSNAGRLKPVPPPAPETPPAASQAQRRPIATEPLPKVYCNECGAEWYRVDDKPFPNCGHTDGFVHDPAKARRYNPPAGHARLTALDGGKGKPTAMIATAGGGGGSLPAGVPSVAATSSAVMIARQGNRLTMEWGKTNFMVAQHSSMGVGPFTLSAELPEGANEVDAARSMLADLRKIADEAFDETWKWYQEKLGILDK